jgi:hypothetical protein
VGIHTLVLHGEMGDHRGVLCEYSSGHGSEALAFWLLSFGKPTVQTVGLSDSQLVHHDLNVY